MKKFLFISLQVILFIPATYAQTTYQDVAPIIFERCTPCHHQNQHAPSMLSYDETIYWAGTIQYVLTNNIMPPWPMDTTYTRFQNEHLISQAEKNALLAWVNDGALPGDTAQIPPPPVYNNTYKLNGTPDLILKIPTFTSNATSTDSYVCFSLPTNLTEDRILRAYEIVPGNVDAVHHVVVMVDSTNSTTTDLSGNCFYPPGDYGIGGYAPGAPPTIFPGEGPLKAGIRIKAGSKVLIQLHYPLGTAGMVDSTQMRMYFYPVGTTDIRRIHVEDPIQNWTLFLPANQVTEATGVNYPGVPVATPMFSSPVDLSVFAAFPHSHKVCSSVINYAFSGTDTVRLLRINKWDFNWQGYYTYKKLVKVPANYEFYGKHVYDNTANNPNNPFDPPQLVTVGTNTTDEMLLDGFQWLEYMPGDEDIDLESILANDPLLSTGINEAHKPARKAEVYPNPLTDHCTFFFPNELQDEVTFTLYDLTGKVVMKENNLEGSSYLFKPEGLLQGIYIAEITTPQDVFRNRLVIKGQ